MTPRYPGIHNTTLEVTKIFVLINILCAKFYISKLFSTMSVPDDVQLNHYLTYPCSEHFWASRTLACRPEVQYIDTVTPAFVPTKKLSMFLDPLTTPPWWFEVLKKGDKVLKRPAVIQSVWNGLSTKVN